MSKRLTGYKIKDEFLLEWLENYLKYENPFFTFQEEILSNFNVDISNGFYDEFIAKHNLIIKKEIDLSNADKFAICNFRMLNSYKKLDFHYANTKPTK